MILAIYGAGAMGREFRMIAQESGEWSEIVFIDDHADIGQLFGCKVYRFQMFRREFSAEEIRFVVAIGEPKYRKESFDRMIRAGYQGAVIMHSTAYVSPDAGVGEGTVICDHAFVGSLARVGRNCYISRNASVGHDAIVSPEIISGTMRRSMWMFFVLPIRTVRLLRCRSTIPMEVLFSLQA